MYKIDKFNSHQVVAFHQVFTADERARPGTGDGAKISSRLLPPRVARLGLSATHRRPQSVAAFIGFSRPVIALWRAPKLLRTKDAARLAQDGLGTDGSVLA